MSFHRLDSKKSSVRAKTFAVFLALALVFCPALGQAAVARAANTSGNAISPPAPFGAPVAVPALTSTASPTATPTPAGATPTPTPASLPGSAPALDPPAPDPTALEVVEPQADPIPQAAQLPTEFALQAAIVAAERAAATAAERAAAAEQASAARKARIVTALDDYDAALTEVDSATRADADARADHDAAVDQAALVHRLATTAARTATASQVSLAGLVRAMAQGRSGIAAATADALFDGGPDTNLLYRLGALDRLDSLTENIHTVRDQVVADRQRADDLAAQDSQLSDALTLAPVTATAAHLVNAEAQADASRARLLDLSAELSLTASMPASGDLSGSASSGSASSDTDLTLSSLRSAADAGALSDQGWALPAVGRVTSSYGPRPDLPLAGVGSVHYGTDVGAGCGAGVYAATSGIVAAVGEVGTYGNWILVDHGEGVATGYAHVAAGTTRVSVGDRVAAGQLIAQVGSTGASTGCHLHFEVRLGGIRVDAVPFLETRGIRLSRSWGG